MTRPLHPSVAAHYAFDQERERLGGDIPTLEAIRTRVLLARTLPDPPAVIWDVGGATGVYALPLARQGYEVHLVDPWPPHVEEATRRSAQQSSSPLASAQVGDARDLRAADASVDAVLLLGRSITSSTPPTGRRRWPKRSECCAAAASCLRLPSAGSPRPTTG